MFGKINFFLSPFMSFINSILFPLLFGGILYYIMRPLVRLIEKIRVPRVWATILAIFIVLAVLTLISAYRFNYKGTGN
jgi:predicted PurR-regulated permease PerM